jgi:hypothetical protein
MSERDGEAGSTRAGDLSAVEARITELQRRKRKTVRWHMSRDTVERAIAAITGDRLVVGTGKCRRRKRHKRLL